ncbi:MAG TPA: chorismate mutase [Herpetosiphonaceae bacterium]|nr:chorismate mutase [Herpetosiphonaceae bacterium]
MVSVKPAAECASLAEVRAAIDEIDRSIVGLIGQRAAYVQAAAAFKSDEAAVRAPERYASMLGQRREWAAAAGLDPDVIEQIYRTLVDYFIARELAVKGIKG